MLIKRKIELEQLAMDLLGKYHITDNPGRHLLEITTGEQITILPHKGWEPKVCGRIMYIDGVPVIFYNEDHDIKMVNFTIAHELGHYYLKHLENEQSEIICMNRDLQKSDDEKDAREVEANFFAACLLMPFNLLKPAFNDFMEMNGRYNGVLYVDKQPCNYSDYKWCIRRLQVYFFASETAIRYRLINLKWMVYNFPLDETEDQGICLTKYLESD